MISKPPPNPAIPSDPSSAQNFLICKQCGASFTSSKSTTLFCSKRCNNRHYYERNRRKKSDTLLCESQPQSNPTIQTAKVDAQVPKYPSSQSSVELITISEAARRLRVCRQTVYNLIHAGKIHELRFTSRLSYIRWPLSAPSPSTAAEPENIKPGPEEFVQPCAEEPATEWISTKQASRRYKVTLNTIYNRVSKQNLIIKKVNGKNRYRIFDLDRIFRKIPKGMLKGFITIADYSQKYGIAPNTIRYNLKNLELERIVVGKAVMFREDVFLKAYKPRVKH